jgi:uncharacterized membrane protein
MTSQTRSGLSGLKVWAAAAGAAGFSVFAAGLVGAAPTAGGAPDPTLFFAAADPSPAPLQCSGTEPFWGLKTAGGRARMSRPGMKDAVFTAGPRRGATGDPRVFVQRLSGPGRAPGQLAVIRRPDGCSDGMSDLLAPYQAVVTTPSGEVLAGCCRRAGD